VTSSVAAPDDTKLIDSTSTNDGRTLYVRVSYDCRTNVKKSGNGGVTTGGEHGNGNFHPL